MTGASITFIGAEDELKGKRAAIVAQMIEQLVEAGPGEPLTWEELTDGIEHSAQYTPAMHALEMVGVIERYSYVEPGKTKPRVAYALLEVEVTG